MPGYEQDVAFEMLKQNEAVIRGAAGANEDTTRLRAIDTVMFDVLGWDRLSVETEKYCRTEGFADYAFSLNNAICLIIEAKRSGITFVLPDRSFGKRPVAFSFLAQECPEAGNALRQAAGYAAQEGARYIAVSNGHQWILALAFVHNQPISERSVFVFESVEAIIDRFHQFWECFSPSGVLSNATSNALLESRKRPAPAKLSSRIDNYPVPAERNKLVHELDMVIGLVWDQMGSDEKAQAFLKECYVRPKASIDSISEAKELLRLRSETDRKVRSEVVDADAIDAASFPSLVERYNPEKPIVVLGRIGHGKSTFLSYLRLVEAAELLTKYIQIDIDFLHRPDDKESVARFVYSEIDEQLQDRYSIDVWEDGLVRGALRSDLQRFRRTPAGKLYGSHREAYNKLELDRIREIQEDKHSYFGRVIYHLKSARGHSLAVFFDNLDRRLDPIQEEAFLRASAIARDWSCLVFVCLRPGTFTRSRESGILDTVAPKTLAIVPPKTTVLLKKRFEYAAQIAEGVRSDLSNRAPLNADISVQLPTTAKFLRCCATSFFRSKKLARLFEAASNGNIRDLLRDVREVLTSKHLDTDKILQKIDRGEGYVIGLHEAVRALLYKDKWQFDPNESVFVNLFDIQRADPTEHFTRLLALHYLDQIPTGTPTFGYCRSADVIQFLCQVGYSDQHASETIRHLHGKDCCESRVPDQPWSGDADSIRMTSLGGYHLHSLARKFEYYDAIVVDTPILDREVRENIRDVRRIEDRLSRGEAFLQYLREASRSIFDGESAQFCDGILDEVVLHTEQIRASLPSSP